jgi:hypothetical protein
MIHTILDHETVIAIHIPATYTPEKTEFLTPDTYKQQTGFIIYPAGGEIVPHIHHEVERNLKGMSEVLLVKKGRCLADFYRQDKTYLCTRELNSGDVLLLVSGGHGFRMIEHTVVIEI